MPSVEANRLANRMRGAAAAGHPRADELRRHADQLDRAVVLGDKTVVVELARAKRFFRRLEGSH